MSTADNNGQGELMPRLPDDNEYGAMIYRTTVAALSEALSSGVVATAPVEPPLDPKDPRNTFTILERKILVRRLLVDRGAVMGYVVPSTLWISDREYATLCLINEHTDGEWDTVLRDAVHRFKLNHNHSELWAAVGTLRVYGIYLKRLGVL